jgi:hypothetical protein
MCGLVRLSRQSPNSCQDNRQSCRLGMAAQDCEGLVRTASYNWLETVYGSVDIMNVT